MTHRLAGFLATWLTGACWLQTELPHFTRPLPVMVTAPRGFPVGLLPDMRHLMGERREDHFISAIGKIVRVEGEFMDRRCIDALGKPFRGKIPSRIRVPLQCHQHLRQTTLE